MLFLFALLGLAAAAPGHHHHSHLRYEHGQHDVLSHKSHQNTTLASSNLPGLHIAIAAGPDATTQVWMSFSTLEPCSTTLPASWIDVSPKTGTGGVSVGKPTCSDPYQIPFDDEQGTKKYPYGTSRNKGLRKVLISSLVAGTSYDYTIGGTKGTFAAMPTAYPINFAVVADMGLAKGTFKQNKNGDPTQLSTIAETIHNDMASKSDLFHAVLDVGDMSYADGTEATWDTYKDSNTLAASKQWMVVAGNHEQKIECFLPLQHRFAMPAAVEFKGPPAGSNFCDVNTKKTYASVYNSGNSFYTFTAGKVRVFALNTYAFLESIPTKEQALAAPQYIWLEGEMRARASTRSSQPWWIVMMHNSFYQTNADHAGEAEGQLRGWFKETYEPLFNAYKVALVVSGHVHAYERSHPVSNGAKAAGAPVYIVIGNGGRDDSKEPYADWKDCATKASKDAKGNCKAGTKPAWSANRCLGCYFWGRLQITSDTAASWSVQIPLSLGNGGYPYSKELNRESLDGSETDVAIANPCTSANNWAGCFPEKGSALATSLLPPASGAALASNGVAADAAAAGAARQAAAAKKLLVERRMKLRRSRSHKRSTHRRARHHQRHQRRHKQHKHRARYA